MLLVYHDAAWFFPHCNTDYYQTFKCLCSTYYFKCHQIWVLVNIECCCMTHHKLMGPVQFFCNLEGESIALEAKYIATDRQTDRRQIDR